MKTFTRKTLVGALACLSGITFSAASGAAPLLGGDAQGRTPPVLLEQANAWVEIDADIFADNLKRLHQHLAGRAKLCAVMKADAYGHSIALLIPTAIAQGVGCIGVTSNEEARVARAQGYKGRLIRLRTATPGEIEDAFAYDLDELMGNLALARSVSERARAKGHTVAIHLALNAGGMARNGLELASEPGQQDALALLKLPNLKLVGLMTHFPVEDREQMLAGLARFKAQTEWLIQTASLNRDALLLHSANSFATLHLPETWLDMVRPGAVLYEPQADAPGYQRVMQFKSRVASVNTYPAGSPVGYSATHTLTRDSLLANIPLGYSDGYPRAFSNKTSVLIHGQRAPVVGRVSMNTFMVDVTDIPGVQTGDEVVLFGKQGEDEITRPELQEAYGMSLTTAYVLWSNSNPRVLKQK